jgi:acyl carrier protein
MNFQARLQYLISWILHLPEQEISYATDFYRDLDLDKTDVDLMMFQLENYYHTELSPDQIQNIHTVQDIGRLLPH